MRSIYYFYKAANLLTHRFLYFIVTVPIHKPEGNKKKAYAKLERCYFCSRYFTSRMSRHLRGQHKNELLVSEALKVKDPMERQRRLVRIQHLGNFVHNCKVIMRANSKLTLPVEWCCFIEVITMIKCCLL